MTEEKEGWRVYSGYSELIISMLSVSKMIYWQRLGETDVVNFDSFNIVNFSGKIYNIRHAWTLKEISGTLVGVHKVDTMNQSYINESQSG